jgi:hypothetical protein
MMMPINSLKPMSKNVCCSNIVLVDEYLKNHHPGISHEEAFKGIIGNEEFLCTDPDTGKLSLVNVDYLLNPDHWVSNKLLNN